MGSWPRISAIGCAAAAEFTRRRREQLDVTDQRALEDAFERTRPAVVFNCAAFHNVDVCEREEDRSFEVNARAVKRLARALRRARARSSCT